MIVIAGAVLGAFIGAFKAKRGGGNGFDMAQYAAGYGIALTLLGLVLTIILERSLGS